MLDFNFCVPNRFIVGKGSAAQVGGQLAAHGAKRVLIVNDGGAYLAELMNTIRASIEAAGLVWLEMEEKATSPRLSLVMKGVEFVRANDIDFILAVGGGTVMDTAKAIGFMAVNDGDFTDYVLYRKASPKSMSVSAVVTLSGTGSEVSGTSMIIDDREEVGIKYPLFQDSIKFKFAIMDPSLTCSLPMKQTLSGAFDAITHIMEHYFCGESGYDLMDRMCEGVISSIMHNMVKVIEDPTDYETRAQLQMGSTLANSTLLGVGCDSDWAMHYMENPITTETHSPHGSTLAIIAPAWMRYCYERDLKKAVNFAVRVMGVAPQADDRATALAGIDAFAAFLGNVGLPTSLKELGITPDRFEEFARRAAATAGKEEIGGVSKLTLDEVVEIYKLAY